MLVQGITRANYDTVGAQRLANAESELQDAIKNNASDKVLLKLQKTVDDLKNSITVREKERQKYLDKMTLTERRVRESQFGEIKQKFDESNERSEKSAEKARESIRAVSEKVGGALDTVFDSVAHTLLGPLNLIVNPLEQALGFNLFKVAKKPVADFLEGKFPATYQKLKDNGGLIGAVGVAIIDAIHGKKTNIGSISGDGSLGIDSLLGSGLGGLSIGSILKGAGVVGLVVAGIVGIVNAWKNDWDKKGIESAKELKSIFEDETATTWDKVKGVFVYSVKAIFGSITGGLKSAWDTLTSKFSEIVSIWTDPNSSTFEKIWDTVKTAVLAIPQTIWNAVGGLLSTLGDYAFGFFGDETQEWWSNFKEKISSTFTYIWESISNYFSWDNLKEQWESLKADPKQWIKDTWNSIKGFFNNIFSKIGQAFTGDDSFDFGSWAKEKLDEIIDAIKNFFSNIWDKIKNAVSNAWDSATGWLTGRETRNVTDANGNIVRDKNGNPVTETTTWMSRTGEAVSGFVGDKWWNPFSWNWGGKKNVEDAIISKNNDLYIPSDDDNILVTKSDVTVQPAATDTAFQTELLNLLRNIADNLKQPTVVNNVQGTSTAIDFGGMRL